MFEAELSGMYKHFQHLLLVMVPLFKDSQDPSSCSIFYFCQAAPTLLLSSQAHTDKGFIDVVM